MCGSSCRWNWREGRVGGVVVYLGLEFLKLVFLAGLVLGDFPLGLVAGFLDALGAD